ncbi:MAG: hypothetical protein WDO70_03910 [Alphaproteobacteria bacterium]
MAVASVMPEDTANRLSAEGGPARSHTPVSGLRVTDLSASDAAAPSEKNPRVLSQNAKVVAEAIRRNVPSKPSLIKRLMQTAGHLALYHSEYRPEAVAIAKFVARNAEPDSEPQRDAAVLMILHASDLVTPEQQFATLKTATNHSRGSLRKRAVEDSLGPAERLADPKAQLDAGLWAIANLDPNTASMHRAAELVLANVHVLQDANRQTETIDYVRTYAAPASNASVPVRRDLPGFPASDLRIA